VAPLRSFAVIVNVWVVVVVLMGVTETRAGGCCGPTFQVAIGSQPVPVLALSVIQV
jgi:hypothetical protein